MVAKQRTSVTTIHWKKYKMRSEPCYIVDLSTSHNQEVELSVLEYRLPVLSSLLNLWEHI